MLKSPAIAPALEFEENTLELDLTDNVVLKRLIEEVREEDTPVERTTAYNRTYHRHNR
ncbi:MAG: hypothetical protein OXC05_15975 [Halieaceae bacterium]|nr:hypothetical protein [Halieaceae bacterium]